MSWTSNEKWYARKHHFVIFTLIQMNCYDIGKVRGFQVEQLPKLNIL
jgi:hypothetical protein